MKKKLAAAMAVVMIVGLSGCSLLGGSKFKKTSDKLVKAAEKVCDAQEADKKQKKAIVKGDFTPTDDMFEDGCYLKFAKDDLEDFSFEMGDAEIEGEDIKNATVVIKSEDSKSGFMALVLEAADEDVAEDLFDGFMEMTEDMDEKSLKSAAKNSDLQYGIDDEDDNKYALAVYSEDYNMASDMLIQRDGKIVIVAMYSGAPDADLLEEFVDFMNEGKFQDFDELLGAEDDEDEDEDEDDEDEDEDEDED